MTDAVERAGDEDRKLGWNEFTGAERFLLGLSPQFWSHTPMLIRDLQSLGLVNGISCFMLSSLQKEDGEMNLEPEVDSDSKRRKRARRHESSRPVFVPVSKCELQGLIVNMDCRSGGSVHYVLDDGTGLVDCVSWSSRDPIYSVPPLLPAPSVFPSDYRVGDTVRILGKIRVIAVGSVRPVLISPQYQHHDWEVRNAVRELHVSFMERTCGYGTHKSSMNGETRHWLRCLDFQRRLDWTAANDTALRRTNQSSPSLSLSGEKRLPKEGEAVRNGAHVLSLLGPDLGTKVAEGFVGSAQDDEFGAWRLFGHECRCPLDHKAALLYCHCHAATEPLDPHHTFRDGLLKILLHMETSTPNSNDTTFPSAQASSPRHDETSGDHSQQPHDFESEKSNHLNLEPLHFQFKTLVNDETLQALAREVLLAGTDGTKKDNSALSQVQRLFINTFRALRNDGIIYLQDRKMDTYLLLSRERVLEPYVAKLANKSRTSQLERNMLRSNRPSFLTHVPPSRLQYIRKSLASC